VTRIVLDLEAPVSYSVSRQSNPPRLLIELKRQGTPATPPMVSESKPAAAEPRSAPPQAEPPPAAPAVQAAATPSATTAPAPREPAAPKPARAIPGGGRTLTRTLGLKLGRVVLDPGHGGNDHGTTGPSGLKEKELVLDIATRLGTLLEEGLGSEVIYTRQEDVFLALEERTALANRRKADLFLSIHANSSPLKSVSGSETYYLNFTTSKVDLEVAARENASSSRSIFELRELIQKIALKEKLDESREFAARVQRSMHSVWVRNGATRNRGVKKAPFVVLIGASMPSVLAEVGFVSNPRDEAYLKKPENRQKIAEGLYRGIEQYARTLSHFDVAQRGAP
jgi:N-acetylmuramoyl-L-alanine amidase